MNLLKVDIDKIREMVNRTRKDFPEIIGAYLFGSALAYCRPDSVIDIGLFVDPGLNLMNGPQTCWKEKPLCGWHPWVTMSLI